MNIHFVELIESTPALLETLNRWGNDPALKPLAQPNESKEVLEQQNILTEEDIIYRLGYQHVFLMYSDDQLIGEMGYMVDPEHLMKKVPATAWLSITIGEPEFRGKGIGSIAFSYLEEQIKEHGLKRMELGVFEFNTPAIKLYEKLGYKEIGRIEHFTYFEGKMWADIRMEKYV